MSPAISFYLCLLRRPGLTLRNPVRLKSGTPNSTKSSEGRVLPPFFLPNLTTAQPPRIHSAIFCTFKHVRISPGTPNVTNPYGGISSGTPTSTNPYCGNPHIRAILYSTSGTATSTKYYGSNHHSPLPPRHLVFVYVTTSGSPNYAVYLPVQPQRRRGRGGSPFTVQHFILPHTHPL